MSQENRNWAKLAFLGLLIFVICFAVGVWTIKMTADIQSGTKSMGETFRRSFDEVLKKNKNFNSTNPTPHLILVDAKGGIEEKAGYPLKDSDKLVVITAMRKGRFEPNSFISSYRFVSILGGVNVVGIKANDQVVFSDKMPLLKVSGNSVSIFWPTSHVVKIHEGSGLLFFSPEDTFIVNASEALEIVIYDSKDILAPRVAVPDDAGKNEPPKSERL